MNNFFIEELNSYKSDKGKSQISVLTNEPMCSHTTFKIGGPAEYFITPRTEEALLYSVSKLKENKIRTFILGRGSNVLFSDKGFSGAVVSMSELDQTTVEGTSVKSCCGASLTSVARLAARHSLTGLEFAFGIPGSIGGAVYMNAGAYGGEVASVIVRTKTIDPVSGVLHSYEGHQHEFGYRESVFRKNGDIILSTEMQLSHGCRDQIERTMAEYLERRQQKQPLEFPSAGSVFKRCEGHFTGQMIEEAGMKGLTVGGAQISEKHAGFIVNIGGATANDVLTLIEIIKDKIYSRFGCKLECEMIYVN